MIKAQAAAQLSVDERDERTNQLLLAAAASDEPDRQRIIDAVVELNLGMAEAVARRFAGRGAETEDLVQIAYVGLVSAARRFDPAKGRSFASFAVPTMSGEIKRHFRDHAWAIRPPRPVQELRAAMQSVAARMTQELGARPTEAQFAESLDVSVNAVRQAEAANGCYHAASLDQPVRGEETTLADALGTTEDGFERVEALAVLAPACSTLPRRDRRILYMRYFEGRTQQEIGDEVGVTQMQVSRLLFRIHNRLRELIDPTAQPPPRAKRLPRRADAARAESVRPTRRGAG